MPKRNVKFEFQYEEDGIKHYKIEAIHVTITGNNRKYTQEELTKAAVSLGARPININHDETLWLPHNTYNPLAPDSNSTEYMEFDPNTKAVVGTLQIVDKDVQEMIDRGDITKLSIEQVPWYGQTSECSLDGCIHEQHGIMFTGIALLTNDVYPGDPATRISRESTAKSKFADKLEQLRIKWGWKKEAPQEQEQAPAKAKVGEPFAGYKDFDDCVSKNADKEDPQAYCASIQNAAESAKKENESPKCGCLMDELRRLEALLS